MAYGYGYRRRNYGYYGGRLPYRRRSYGTYVPRKGYRSRRVKSRRSTSDPLSSMRRGAASMRSAPKALSPGEKFVIAQLDPFHSLATGAKIPDANTVPSISTTDMETLSLSLTTGTNQKAWAFQPQWTWASVAATEGAASWTWPVTFGGGTNRTRRTDYLAAVDLTRPVGHAVRISCPNAPTTTTGFIHIGIAYQNLHHATTWNLPSSIGEMTGCENYKRVTLASLTQSPLTIVNKFCDETAFRYLSSNVDNDATPTGSTSGSTLMFHVPQSWGTIVIAVEGGNTTAPLSVEHMLISEGIAKRTGVLQGTPAAISQPDILNGVSNMVANSEATHSESTQVSYFRDAMDSFVEGAGEAGEYVFRHVVVPGARAAGGTAVRYVAHQALGRRGGGIPGVNVNRERIEL